MRSIKSVVKIKNFPAFIDFKPATNLPEFSKFNLIYGWNGSGKTTFSRILRTFELEINSYSSPTSPSEYEFNLNNGAQINEADLTTFKEIRVFNRDFIEDSIFCVNGPKPIFFLGKESKEDQEKIDKIETERTPIMQKLEEKRALLTKAKDSRDKGKSNKARDIKNALITARLDKYRNYERDTLEKSLGDNAEKLKEPSKLLLTDSRLAALKKTILQTSGKNIQPLIMPNFDTSALRTEIGRVITKSITSSVIEALKSDEELSKWVEHGLGIHTVRKLDTCAFCNQRIPEHRLTELGAHFNDEYQRTMDTLKVLSAKVDMRFMTITLPDSSEFYDDLSPAFLSEKEKAETIVKVFNQTLTDFTRALHQKERNIFSVVQLAQETTLDNTPFIRINELIKKHNEKTANFEEQITADKEALELHYIAEFLPSHTAALAECKNLDDECTLMDSQLKTKEQEIKSLKESLITHHVPAKEINEGLEKFLARSDIQLKAAETNDGYQITRNNEVAQNLSEGEKTALAIVYFITKLKEDGFDLKSSVIVIDDPVSSLDASGIFQAFSFLKESIKDAGQIFILTHHFDFFRQVKNWFCHCKKDDRAFFMMICRNESGIRKSEITPIDKLLIDYESEYHFLFSILYNFSKNNRTDLEYMYPLPNVARKFLESFLAFRVPILKNKEPNTFNRLKEITFDETTKTRINRFVETHSHPRYENGVQDFDMTLIGETPAIVEDLLKLVETEDKKHYDFLVQSITS